MTEYGVLGKGTAMNMLWKFEAADAIFTTPAVSHGLVIFQTEGGYIHCLRLKDGSEAWATRVSGQGTSSSPCIVGNHVYIGSGDTCLFCLDIRTGAIEWKFDAGVAVGSSPLAVGELIYVGDTGGWLHCLSHSGRKMWQFKTGDRLDSDPALIDNVLIFGSYDGYLYSVRADEGKLLWKRRNIYPSNALPTIAGDTVVFCTDLCIFRMSLDGNKTLWKFGIRDEINAAAAVTSSRVYFGSLDQYIYCLDLETGTLIWKFQTGDSIQASPTVVGDRVFIGSHDGWLYAFDAINGKVLDRFRTKEGIVGSAVAVADRVLLGATDHCLYCAESGVQCEDECLLFRYNACRTGVPKSCS
jgi:outer membrane protein assembly factor BamB